MATSPMGLGPESDCAAEAQEQSTDPSSHQRGRPTLTTLQLPDMNTNLVMDPRGVPGIKTDWPIDWWSNISSASVVLRCC
jgi:hypothetical protein